jgi:hypothetical protein
MEQQAREQAFITALVTEHFALQSARSATIGEANGRAAIYLSAVSAPWSPSGSWPRSSPAWTRSWPRCCRRCSSWASSPTSGW